MKKWHFQYTRFHVPISICIFTLKRVENTSNTPTHPFSSSNGKHSRKVLFKTKEKRVAVRKTWSRKLQHLDQVKGQRLRSSNMILLLWSLTSDMSKRMPNDQVSRQDKRYKCYAITYAMYIYMPYFPCCQVTGTFVSKMHSNTQSNIT